MIEDIEYTVGQKWLQLEGAFTSDELREIADEIDRYYDMAFAKKDIEQLELIKKDIENNGDTK